MRERPILFSAPMVRAILDGSKSQTRRIINPKHIAYIDEHQGFREPCNADVCPHGQSGDKLWVRETHFINHFKGAQTPVEERQDTEILYRATDMNYVRNLEDSEGLVWKPSIHMPRWASRILLEITAVRVERLQDISEHDAQNEGCESLDFDREERNFNICPKCGGTRLHDALGSNMGVIFDVDCTQCDTYKKRYRHLWESINGTGSWEANPWVWIVEFKVVKP